MPRHLCVSPVPCHLPCLGCVLPWLCRATRGAERLMLGAKPCRCNRALWPLPHRAVSSPLAARRPEPAGNDPSTAAGAVLLFSRRRATLRRMDRLHRTHPCTQRNPAAALCRAPRGRADRRPDCAARSRPDRCRSGYFGRRSNRVPRPTPHGPAPVEDRPAPRQGVADWARSPDPDHGPACTGRDPAARDAMAPQCQRAGGRLRAARSFSGRVATACQTPLSIGSKAAALARRQRSR